VLGEVLAIALYDRRCRFCTPGGKHGAAALARRGKPSSLDEARLIDGIKMPHQELGQRHYACQLPVVSVGLAADRFFVCEATELAGWSFCATFSLPGFNRCRRVIGAQRFAAATWYCASPACGLPRR
jgi:hypothetical protein